MAGTESCARIELPVTVRRRGRGCRLPGWGGAKRMQGGEGERGGDLGVSVGGGGRTDKTAGEN